MQNKFDRALSVGVLFAVMAGLSQQASFAGFGNMFGGGSDSGSSGSSSSTSSSGSSSSSGGSSLTGPDAMPFVPPGAMGQISDPDPQSPLIKSKKKEKDASGTPANGDFTSDEKAMQARYRARIAYAHKNIDKGEKMMKDCGNDHNKPEYKKGKVWKEIGEKDLAELKSNSPFPSNSSLDPDRPAKAKPDSL